MFAVSTIGCKNFNIADYITPLTEIGIDHFELGMQHSSNVFLPNGCKISNLILPAQGEDVNVPSLSSAQSQEREEAVNRLYQAVQKAHQFKTPYVVIWPGYVKLTLALNDISSEKSPACNVESLKKRRDMAPAFVERLCRSLFDAWKLEPDIVFCIPPARNFWEIPLIDEFEWITQDLPHIKICYWHNTAFSHILQKSKITEAHEWLYRYRKNTIGVHLEDVIEGNLLLPPGSGEVDFASLKNLLPQNAIRVLRINSSFGVNEIWHCCQHLRQLGLI